jgi:ribokinase
MDSSINIAVLGSINMDLVIRCRQLPRPGETIMADDSAEVPGGKGANQAVAASRLGATVQMIGRVGDDAFADRLLDNLAREGVGTALIRRSANCASGLAVVSVDKTGENSIIVVPGANRLLSVEDVSASADAIRDSDVLLLQLEVPLETVSAAAQLARDAAVPVILDPAPAPTELPAELRRVDVICPNQAETTAILGRPIESIEDARGAARELTRRGAKAAMITMGAEGAVVSNGKQVDWIEPFPVQAVDSTAAGDAFAAAVAVRLASGMSPVEAAQFGCAAGAVAATRHGAQPGMPSLADVASLRHG